MSRGLIQSVIPVAVCLSAGLGTTVWAQSPPPIQWGQQFGTAETESTYALTVDPFGNVLIAGQTRGQLDGGTPPPRLVRDLFIRKFDPAGNEIWTVQDQSAPGTRLSLTTDHLGNIFVSGSPSSGVRKYDTNGVYQWAGSSSSSLIASGVGTDVSGNAYIAGHARHFTDDDIRVEKYSPAGVSLASFWFGSSADEDIAGGDALAVDQAGNIFVTGTTLGTVGDASFGSQDAFVTKFNPAGAELWTRQFGSSGYDFASGLALDPSGNVYVVGDTQGDLTRPVQGNTDAFIAKYDNDGNLQWMDQFGGAGDEIVDSVGVGPDGDLVLSVGIDGVFLENHSLAVRKVDAATGSEIWLKDLGKAATNPDVSLPYALSAGAAVDEAGGIYLAGDFNGEFQGLSTSGDYDAFLMKLATPVPGDLNGDGVVTNGDISAFVLALTDPDQFANLYPLLDADELGDLNGDQTLTNGDISGFVALLTGSGSAGAGIAAQVPEPTSLACMLLLGMAASYRRRA